MLLSQHGVDLEIMVRQRMVERMRAAQHQRLVREAQRARPQRVRLALGNVLVSSGRWMIRIGKNLSELQTAHGRAI